MKDQLLESSGHRWPFRTSAHMAQGSRLSQGGQVHRRPLQQFINANFQVKEFVVAFFAGLVNPVGPTQFIDRHALLQTMSVVQ